MIRFAQTGAFSLPHRLLISHSCLARGIWYMMNSYFQIASAVHPLRSSMSLTFVLSVSLPFTSPNFSRPKLDPLKIYSPKPVFGYNTVHFDLDRSFTPDESEHFLSPNSSNTTIGSRKRPKPFSDMDDGVSTKKLKTVKYLSNVGSTGSKSTRFSSCPFTLSYAVSSSRNKLKALLPHRK